MARLKLACRLGLDCFVAMPLAMTILSIVIASVAKQSSPAFD